MFYQWELTGNLADVLLIWLPAVYQRWLKLKTGVMFDAEHKHIFCGVDTV